MVVEREMFTGPAQAGDEREKSSVRRSPATVRSSATLSGSSTTPSLSSQSSTEARPSGKAAIWARMIRAARALSSTIAWAITASPYSSSSACILRTPRSSALIWPLRSP